MDELELAGLTPVPSKLVKPPRVAESVVQLECKLRGTHETKNAKGESTGRIMIGEVSSLYIIYVFYIYTHNLGTFILAIGQAILDPGNYCKVTCLSACTPRRYKSSVHIALNIVIWQL